MSNRGGNAPPKKRARKRPQEVDPSSMSDLEIFMAIDLYKTESIATYIPMEARGGRNRMIPRHVLAPSEDPMDCVRSAREFRLLQHRRQRDLTLEWKAMSRADQKLYNNRLKVLTEKRRQMEIASACSSVSSTAAASRATETAPLPRGSSTVRSCRLFFV